jgi:lipid-A-disaccharide synthase
VRILISAGEASGDMYAAQLAQALKLRWPDAHFFGCAGPRLKELGTEVVVDSASLAVVGLAEVVAHLPRIYGEYRKLVRRAREDRPDLAILTDSPDFHLRLARHLKRAGVPVFYLVAPQVWAWRQGRVRIIRDRIDKLFCLFPFEEPWFRKHGVDASYIGHPLAARVRPCLSKEEFLRKHRLKPDQPVVTLLPGSRVGEAQRHLPVVLDAVERLRQNFAPQMLLASPKTFKPQVALEKFWERISALSIQVVEGETWDCLAHSDLALAASGTVTVEAAVLGTPLVTFYKVAQLSWWAGRRLVKVPYLSMVNLIANRRIVPELIQDDMTGERLAREAAMLLSEPSAVASMRHDLAQVRAALQVEGDPMERAADLVVERWEKFATA